MAEIICPHCKSKYADKKGDSYQCLSCKKYFTVADSSKKEEGKWIMTLEGEYSSTDFAKVFKKADGTFEIQQTNSSAKVNTVTSTPKLYVQQMGDHAFITYYNFKSPNDPKGRTFTVHKIKMNKELEKKALSNECEAMKIAYKYGYFDTYGSNNAALLKDICEYVKPIIGAEGKGGCYVATCVYGSYDCPQVWTLRRYRDDILAETPWGRAFIRFYYAVSPTLVETFGHTDWFKKLCRGILDKMVAKLQKNGMENTPYQDKM